MTRRRIAGLDGLRAAAALYVLAYHVSVFAAPSSAWLHKLTDPGWAGVDIFFTISGFILTLPFMRSAWEGKTVDLRRYSLQRLRRILPAYWLNLLVLVVFASNGLLTNWHGWKVILSNATYTAGYFSQPQINGVYWTLFCEMAFYLFLPVMALLFRGRRFIVGAPVLILAAFAFKLWLVHRFLSVLGQLPASQRAALGTALQQFPAVLDEFAVGMTLAALWAWIEHRGCEVPRWCGWALTLLGATGFATTLWFLENRLGTAAYWYGTSHFGFAPLIGVKPLLSVWSAIVIFGVCYRPTWVTNAFDFRPVRYLGIVSYGIYLWHLPVVERVAGSLPTTWSGDHRYAVTLVVAGLLAVAFAEISFRFVESRFLGGAALRLRGIAVPSTAAASRAAMLPVSAHGLASPVAVATATDVHPSDV